MADTKNDGSARVKSNIKEFHMSNNHPNKAQPSLFNKQTLETVAGFCRDYYILGLFLIYAIGTFILAMRNLVAGFPFAALSIIQYAAILFYATLMVAPLIVVNVAQQGIYEKRSQLRFFARIKLTFQFLGGGYLIIMLLAILLWTVFLGNLILATFCVLPAYIIVPVLGIFRGSFSWFIKIVIYATAVWIIIFQVPISAGGLKAFPVAFCPFSSEECQTYTFFGEANGLYQFRDGNDILLTPTDSGYIRYDKSLAR